MAFAWKASHGHVATPALLEQHSLTDFKEAIKQTKNGLIMELFRKGGGGLD